MPEWTALKQEIRENDLNGEHPELSYLNELLFGLPVGCLKKIHVYFLHCSVKC